MREEASFGTGIITYNRCVTLRRTACAAVILLHAMSVAAQAPRVDEQQLVRDVNVLAADDMEGRLAGSPGGAKARDYVLRRFREAGVQPIDGNYERPFTFASRSKEPRKGVNLIGTIRGSRSPAEFVVVTAHYDHIGVRNGQVFNGADDNATGVAALLAVAAHFSREAPEHSLLIAALDAEEAGLHGAWDLVRNPPVPLASMAVDVNLDMLGRDAQNRLWATGTHQYPFLKPYLEHVAQPPVTLALGHDVPGTKEEDWTRDSDHYAFHQSGIPFVYFGVEDNEQHHKATDDAATIMKEFFSGAVNTVIAAVREIDRHLEEIQKRTSSR
jgi:Zn-dependent M28 family amino/carboxypeptidase